MRLYLLRPVEPWQPWYDKCFGFVVRAESDDDARLLASSSDECGDEESEVWKNPALTTCVEVLNDGERGVIIKDFASA